MRDDPRFEGYDSYLMSAYVKFMEGSGARVVPLIWGEPEEVTMDKLSKLNGVLFPGGGGDYVEFGRTIMNKLIEYNDNGDFYPAWGTCLGFENMNIWASDRDLDILERYDAHNISLTLDFQVDPSESTMFADLGEDAWKFETTAMTLNSHMWGINPDSYTTDESLSKFYRLTSVSYEPDTGRPFAASMEAYNYPFFATQFHPEKTVTIFYEEGINHTWESILNNRYMADHFMSYVRQNTHYYGNFATV